MKKIELIILALLCFSNLLAQDGSDIQYVKDGNIDSSLIGKYAHIDFHKRSFNSASLDSIKILIDEDSILFIENRVDNGYNNWFHQQYLESKKPVDGEIIRIAKTKIKEISSSSIFVDLYVDYFKVNNDRIKSNTGIVKNVKFNRKVISELLIDIHSFVGTGIEIYQFYSSPLLESKKTVRECAYCINTTKKDLRKFPLIGKDDIVKFDLKNQVILLTEEAKERINKLNIPLEGLPVVLTLNGEIIYTFWFWNLKSSFGCDRVFTYPKLDFKIKFGLPKTNTFGTDPRFDKRLIDYVNEN